MHFNYAGNWTALYCTGGNLKVPPRLQPGTYLFPGSMGYDGQMYRYVAHDPFLRNDLVRFTDSAALRYRRILVPFIAWTVAFGHGPAIDATYILTMAAWVWLGCWWTGLYLARHGAGVRWSLLFLLLPATLMSMDRLTIDIALATLTIGVVYYLEREQIGIAVGLLALACLARETGLLVLGGALLAQLAQRRFRSAMLCAAAAIPAGGWFLFVATHVASFGPIGAGVPAWVLRPGVFPIFERLANPVHYPLPPAIAAITRGLDSLALAGMILAFAAAIYLVASRKWTVIEFTALLFVGLALLVNTRGFWDYAQSYARVFSIVLVLLALHAVRERRMLWAALVPLALIDVRLLWQLGPQAIGIFRGLLG